MHRTWGTGYVEEDGGKHRYIDQNPPTVPGTIDVADSNNAIQEELCNIVELVFGEGTLNGGGANGTPSADKAAGWRQLYDAIFNGSHITDSAIDEITFAKISGNIALTEGSHSWYQSSERLQYVEGTENVIYSAQRVLISKTDTNHESNLSVGNLEVKHNNVVTNYNGRGINYSNGPGESTLQSMYIRRAMYDITVGTWANIADSNGDQIRRFTCTPNYTTTIPNNGSYQILGAWVVCTQGSEGLVFPAHISWDVSTNIRVLQIAVSRDSQDAPPVNFKLILEYDGSSLSI